MRTLPQARARRLRCSIRLVGGIAPIENRFLEFAVHHAYIIGI